MWLRQRYQWPAQEPRAHRPAKEQTVHEGRKRSDLFRLTGIAVARAEDVHLHSAVCAQEAQVGEKLVEAVEDRRGRETPTIRTHEILGSQTSAAVDILDHV